MTLKMFFLIITCVTLSALAQMVMKMGMSSSYVQSAIADGFDLGATWTILSSLYVVLGLAMYVLGAALWLLVLSKVDVSMAYPFVGLGFIMTMFLGWAFLNESVGAVRIVGTLLIVAGVILVSSS